MNKPHSTICRHKGRYPISRCPALNGGGHERLHVMTIRNCLWRIRQHSHTDLALRRPASIAQNRTVKRTYCDGRTNRRRTFHPLYRAREYPWMPAVNGTFTSLSEKNLIHLKKPFLNQNRPLTRPDATSTSMRRYAGDADVPGISFISPATGTTSPAPR